MTYLQPADYTAFGLTGATDAQVAAASATIDAYLGRTDGLLWSSDANGNPAWMTNKTATRSYSTSNVTPGANVTITIPNANFGEGDVGSVVILDRAVQPEACVINAASGNTITLDAVQLNHATATVELGLTIAQEAHVGRWGNVQTSATPLVSVLSLYGSRRRHARGIGGNWFEEILSIGTTPSTQPWIEFPVSQLDIDYQRGVLSLLPGPIPLGFGRVRVNYIAGWSYSTLPFAIKQAVANIVNATIATPELAGNIQTLKAGDSTITKFRGGIMDQDTINMLAPFRTLRI